jgi:hypothetical protein
MHFERNLFRIYDVLLHRLAMDHPSLAGAGANCGPLKACRTVLTALATVTMLVFAMLVTVHVTHVGSGGCLSEALAVIANGTDVATYFPPDAVIRLRVADEAPYVGLLGQAADPSPDFAPHYVFSGVQEGVTLGQGARVAHGFRVYNVTVPVWCTTTGTGAAVVSSGLVSYDTVAVNSAMYSFPTRGGYLLSAYSGEAWSWPPVVSMESDLKGIHAGTAGFGGSLAARLGGLLLTGASFFLMSSLSALFLRVVMVSGPALLWPLVACVGGACSGERRLGDTRELGAAYPWLGIHLRYAAAAGWSAAPLLGAHATYAFVSYALYVSAATVWGEALLAGKSHPAGLWQELFFVFLAAEYFSLLFVRSTLSMLVFPRVFAAMYVGWAAVWWAYPYPFATLGVALFFLATLLLMAGVVLAFEVPALRAGTLTVDKPRAYLSLLPGPGSPAAAPPEWSLFYGLNYVPTGLYEAAVPPRPVVGVTDDLRGAAVVGGGGGAAAATPPPPAGLLPAGVVMAGADAARDGGSGGGGRRPLLDQDELRASGHAEQFP